MRGFHAGVGEMTAESGTPNVLCPELYRRLRQLFHKVDVVNRGGRFVSEAHWDSKRSRWATLVQEGGEHYRVDCPFCNDRRGRLWINHRFGQFDKNDRRMIHLATCYNEEHCLDDWDKRLILCDNIFGFKNRNDRDTAYKCREGVEENTEVTVACLPGECVPVQDLPMTHPAIQYMCGKRGYDLAFLAEQGCTFCTRADPRWRQAAGRIIVPIYFDGILAGWQGRWPEDLDWKAAGFPKYYTLPGMPKRKILYNFDSAKRHPFVIVCEGITDVWATGPWAVGLLGSALSYQQQCHLLSQWSGQPIIIMLDGGENERSIMQHMVDQLLSGQQPRSPVPYVQLPEDRDPGSYQGNRETLMSLVRAQVRAQGIILPDGY